MNSQTAAEDFAEQVRSVQKSAMKCHFCRRTDVPLPDTSLFRPLLTAGVGSSRQPFFSLATGPFWTLTEQRTIWILNESGRETGFNREVREVNDAFSPSIPTFKYSSSVSPMFSSGSAEPIPKPFASIADFYPAPPPDDEEEARNSHSKYIEIPDESEWCTHCVIFCPSEGFISTPLRDEQTTSDFSEHYDGYANFWSNWINIETEYSNGHFLKVAWGVLCRNFDLAEWAIIFLLGGSGRDYWFPRVLAKLYNGKVVFVENYGSDIYHDTDDDVTIYLGINSLYERLRTIWNQDCSDWSDKTIVTCVLAAIILHEMFHLCGYDISREDEDPYDNRCLFIWLLTNCFLWALFQRYYYVRESRVYNELTFRAGCGDIFMSDIFYDINIGNYTC